VRDQRIWWLAAGGLLVLAGLLLAGAAAVRWWPCLGDGEAGTVCLSRESVRADYLVPVGDWLPLPAASVLAGLGILTVAVAAVLVIRRLAIKPVLRLVLLLIMIGKPVLLGGLSLLAPVTGPLPLSANPVLLVGEIVVDLALVGCLLAAPGDPQVDFQRLVLTAVPVWLTGWAGPVLDGAFFSLTDRTAEVAPGTGLLTAAIIAGCGIGIAVITRNAPPPRSPVLGARPTLEGPAHR
jgi:hypothetical protein